MWGACSHPKRIHSQLELIRVYLSLASEHFLGKTNSLTQNLDILSEARAQSTGFVFYQEVLRQHVSAEDAEVFLISVAFAEQMEAALVFAKNTQSRGSRARIAWRQPDNPAGTRTAGTGPGAGDFRQDLRWVLRIGNSLSDQGAFLRCGARQFIAARPSPANLWTDCLLSGSTGMNSSCTSSPSNCLFWPPRDAIGANCTFCDYAKNGRLLPSVLSRTGCQKDLP